MSQSRGCGADHVVFHRYAGSSAILAEDKEGMAWAGLAAGAPLYHIPVAFLPGHRSESEGLRMSPRDQRWQEACMETSQVE